MPLIVNVGLLGHVDSGKTSLCRVLSEISSTAFDGRQSQERGITLDLGFTALTVDDVDSSSRLKAEHGSLTFCFVDCPGHQSLIRTIIGGSQIIDMMILVIDIRKGFETQTGECLILGEVTEKPLIVVLNKIDMIEDSKREATIAKVTKKVQKTLELTSFRSTKIIPVSAINATNIDRLRSAMIEEVEAMNLTRNIQAPFVFAFDHCFAIKGSGTVLSGTVLRGSVKVNDTIEIPHMKTDRKIKSMQMFRKPVSSGSCGDRLGICVTNFDPKQVERGLICQKNSVLPVFAVIIKLNRIRHFKRDIKTRSKFHCSVGHQTVLGNIFLFSSEDSSDFNWNAEYKYEDQLSSEDPDNSRNFFALIEFENSVLVHDEMLLIGSKLDSAEQSNVCRLAFHGKVSIENSTSDANYQQTFLPNLKVFKAKSKEGDVQRIVNEYEAVSSLFKKESDREKFVGMKVQLSTGESGTIAGAFGQSSKVRIQFAKPLPSETIEAIKNTKSVKVQLNFHKFVFDKAHKMRQSQ